MYELSAAEQIFAQGEAKGKTEGEAKGEARGKVGSIITILKTRGFTISSEIEKKLKEAKESGELDTLITRAVTVSSIDHLFQPPSSPTKKKKSSK